MTTTDVSTPQAETDDPVELYRRFLRAFNTRDYDTVAELIAVDFADHHPGFTVTDIKTYLTALRRWQESLAVTGELLEAIPAGDKVITRLVLSGQHNGELYGKAPTGKRVSWTTTEIWRVSGGRMVERWAQDDLLGLREQILEDDANVALITKLNDVVNERRYDDLDELFGPQFEDHNPAWNVSSLAELKDIIASAHQALDFTSHHDLIYPADGGKVVIHITFTGRHVKPFFGRQPTGEQVSWTSIEVYRIVDNLIVERWTQADTTGLMAQVGVPLPG